MSQLVRVLAPYRSELVGYRRQLAGQGSAINTHIASCIGYAGLGALILLTPS